MSNLDVAQLRHYYVEDDQPILPENALQAALQRTGEGQTQVDLEQLHGRPGNTHPAPEVDAMVEDAPPNHQQAAEEDGLHVTREGRPTVRLERLDGRPVSIHTTAGVEAMAFAKVYPTGQNHYHTAREVDIRNGEYFKARALNADPRCQDPHYMAWLASTYQYLQLQSQVKIAMRWTTGTPTVGQVREQAEDPRVEGLNGSKVWAFMEGIRGSAAYWSRSGKDCFAMFRALGPATWFLTLSADDMGWDDLAISLLNTMRARDGLPPIPREEYEAVLRDLDARDNARSNLFLSNQAMAARHFDHRFKLFWKEMQANAVEWLGGEIADYFYRVEFQRRGSPHIHMIVWIEGAPNLDTEEGRAAAPAFIHNVVRTTVPEESDDPEEQDLRDLVLKVQLHRHTHTCLKAGRSVCRFKYPKQLSESTRLVTSADSRQGLRRCDFYLTDRRPGDQWVVPYSPAMLRRWRANMDIQLIGNSHAANVYVSGYMTKAETEGLEDAIQNDLDNLPEGSSFQRVLTKVGTTCFRHRQKSLQEQTYLLDGLPLKGKSRVVESLCVSRPENRRHLVAPAAVRDLQDEETTPLQVTKFDFYRNRPERLEDLSLVQFVRGFDVISGRPSESLQRQCFEIRMDDGNIRYAKARSKEAVLNIHPRMKEETHGDDYYYGLLLQHVPFRSEEDLTAGHASAKESWIRKATTQQVATDDMMTVLDLEDMVRAYQALEPEGVHDNDGLQEEYEPDANPEYEAFRASGNLQQNLEAYIDGLIPDPVIDVPTNGHVQPAVVHGQDALAPGVGGQGRMDDATFNAHKASMSAAQRDIFDGVRMHIRSTLDAAGNAAAEPIPPLRWFVTGGAGVGKSFTINLLRELILRAYHDSVDPVVLAAPTGVAAFNIGGTTLHTALKLPVEDGHGAVARSRYEPLEAEVLTDMRHKWRDVRYLIIDETSMVGYNQLVNINRRLQELKPSSSREPFGGISIICVGDLYQLPPVKARWVFEGDGRGHLWRSLFALKELTVNQRQRGDAAWSASLNVIREGTDGPELRREYEALKSRISARHGGPIVDGMAWEDAPRLFARTHDTNEYNEDRLEHLIERGAQNVTLTAGHALIKPNGVVVRDNAISVTMRRKIPRDADNCGGLQETVRLAVGARVMLRRNIHTEDGLVNGVQGTIVGFQWPQGQRQAGTQPSAVLIRFDHNEVGMRLRELTGSPDGVTPIQPVSSRFKSTDGRYQFERYQFPLTLAWAITIHRVQGLSLDKAVIDLGHSIFAHGQAYVALSRVRTLAGVLLTDLTYRSFTKTDRKVVQEYARLRAV